MTDEKKFAGFEQPRENWSKLPHALIDEFVHISTESELKVILYILRHTWGYHDSEKKITIDEFCNGRKRRDGSRIDGGCRIADKSVRAGIENAVKHGYITVEEDASDRARIKRWYSLASLKAENDTLLSSRGEESKSRGEESTPLDLLSSPRTEKDTLERNLKKDKDEEDGASARGEVHKLWQQNMPGMLTAIIVDDINDLVDTYGAEEVKIAITQSVRNNGRSIKYVQKVLENRAAGRDKQPENGVSGHKPGDVISVINQYTGKVEQVTL